MSSIAASALLFAIAAPAYGYLCDQGYLYKRSERSVRLTCRTLNPKVDNVHISNNRFAKEFDELFLYITDVLDFAACKFIDKSTLPLLVQQEYNHALMHKVNKIKYVRRFEPIRIAFDWLMLRSGKTIGLAMTCAIEVGTSAYTHALLKQTAIPNICSHAVLFHLMEEVEHSCLTTGHLRPQIAWPVRILLTPMCIVVAFIISFGFIITLLAADPKQFLDRTMYPELAAILIAFVPAFLGFAWDTFLHFTPPGEWQGETFEKREERILLMAEAIKAAGVDFVAGESEEYKVVM